MQVGRGTRFSAQGGWATSTGGVYRRLNVDRIDLWVRPFSRFSRRGLQTADTIGLRVREFKLRVDGASNPFSSHTTVTAGTDTNPSMRDNRDLIGVARSEPVHQQVTTQLLINLLDNILLSSILFQSWRWSRSNKRGINVIAVRTNGYPEKALGVNRESAPRVSRRTGTRLESTSARRYNSDLSKGLAESEGIEPPHAVSAAWPGIKNPAHYRSGNSPLNGHGNRSRTGLSEVQARRPAARRYRGLGAGGEGASQTFDSPLALQNDSVRFDLRHSRNCLFGLHKGSWLLWRSKRHRYLFFLWRIPDVVIPLPIYVRMSQERRMNFPQRRIRPKPKRSFIYCIQQLFGGQFTMLFENRGAGIHQSHPDELNLGRLFLELSEAALASLRSLKSHVQLVPRETQRFLCQFKPSLNFHQVCAQCLIAMQLFGEVFKQTVQIRARFQSSGLWYFCGHNDPRFCGDRPDDDSLSQSDDSLWSQNGEILCPTI